MTKYKLLLSGLFFISFFSGLSSARPMADQEVPDSLKPWVDWVLWEHQNLDCPMFYNSNQRRCVWPTALELELTDGGGRFAHSVRIYRESKLQLPGSNDYWPIEVMVNDQPETVFTQNAKPHIQLDPGEHKIEGRFIWERLPEALPVPAKTGLLTLQVNGTPRDHPELKEGQLWVREGTLKSPRTPQDRLSFEVFRRVTDDHPMRLQTRLKLEVSGKQREVILGKPLLDGFIPQQIKSPLPARLENDGRLRVQVRPGQWDIEIHALHPDYLTALSPDTQPAPWPETEIWSFEAQPALRLVEIEGPVQVDPRQTRLPPEWASLPAYGMKPGETLKLKVVRRGDPQPEPDKLHLQRDLWLDFNGQGYTLRDQINGSMTSGWRLSVDPELLLGRVTLNGEPQFITRLSQSDRHGIEVRRGAIELVAESRLEGPQTDLSASGWGRDFQQVGAVLHLPPGWRLLAVTGVDSEHHSWLKQWTLYDLFLVFIIAAAVGKLWGWRWAALTLLSLALIWHEPGAPRHIWLYLLALTALERALPEGKYRTASSLARGIGLAILLVIALPFMVEQARNGIYPQLTSPGRLPVPVTRPEVSGMMQSAPEAPISSYREGTMDYLEEKLSSVGGARAKRFVAPSQNEWKPDPKANIQTGPGLPNWQWQRIPLNWNGPVAESQRIQFTLAGPMLNLSLNFLRILLLLLLAWRFAQWRSLQLPAPKTAGAAVMILFGLSLGGAPEPLKAQTAGSGFPPQAVLEQLEQRLIQPPDCLPHCADIQRMYLELEESTLSARLLVHAEENSIIPLPLDTQQQTPVEVLLDNQPVKSMARDSKGHLWLEVGRGTHEILLSARLPNHQQLQIPLPLAPHRVDVSTTAWAVEGLRENQVPDRQLHLIRKQSSNQPADKTQDVFAPQALPPFVRVERTLRLGLEWSLETRVQRLSPSGTPIVLHVPLLADEAVITEGIRVKEGKALVNMGPTSGEIHWRSRLPMIERIELKAPQSSRWVELWQLDVGPVWHAEIEGLAPVHHQAQNRWLPTWKPWPSESVSFHLTRPQGVEGTTRTIDRSTLTLRPGKRATDVNLEFHLRSSQGGRHEIRLPTGAELLAVKIDNRSQPIRQEGETVSLPLHPGEQTFQLEWRQDQSIQAHWQTPSVELGLPTVNSTIQVQMARDRWVLFAAGPQLGPAVLFWGELLVILLAALILGRLRDYSPLRTVSWLLLGIGLSQVSIWSGLLVVGTFFAFGYRRRIQPDEISGTFNLLQVVLVLLSLFTLASLFWAVQQGLLGLPQMQIGGNGSSAYQLNWYQDRADGQLPTASIYSVPLLVYRLLMLAWALWLAFSLLSWVKWAWEAFGHRGRWIAIKVHLPKRARSKKEAPKQT